jgi:hypothetical protein
LSRLLNEPEHWRQRAEQMITMADGLTDPVAKETMLSVAAGYERLAQRADERLLAAARKARSGAIEPPPPNVQGIAEGKKAG